jgi:PAS domain-containing protein
VDAFKGVAITEMPQREIEQILTRQLASHLAMPAFIVDDKGTLIYYNEPAEKILGRRFEETFEMPMEDWATSFSPMDEEGNPVPDSELPLVIALFQRKPSYSRFFIEGHERVRRLIEVTAFPLTGRAGADERNLGAVALFWEATKR